MKITLNGTYNEIYDWLTINLPLLNKKPKNPKLGDRWEIPTIKSCGGSITWDDQLSMTNKQGKRELAYVECTHKNIWHTKTINAVITD